MDIIKCSKYTMQKANRHNSNEAKCANQNKIQTDMKKISKERKGNNN